MTQFSQQEVGCYKRWSSPETFSSTLWVCRSNLGDKLARKFVGWAGWIGSHYGLGWYRFYKPLTRASLLHSERRIPKKSKHSCKILEFVHGCFVIVLLFFDFTVVSSVADVPRAPDKKVQFLLNNIHRWQHGQPAQPQEHDQMVSGFTSVFKIPTQE